MNWTIYIQFSMEQFSKYWNKYFSCFDFCCKYFSQLLTIYRLNSINSIFLISKPTTIILFDVNFITCFELFYETTSKLNTDFLVKTGLFNCTCNKEKKIHLKLLIEHKRKMMLDMQWKILHYERDFSRSKIWWWSNKLLDLSRLLFISTFVKHLPMYN